MGSFVGLTQKSVDFIAFLYCIYITCYIHYYVYTVYSFGQNSVTWLHLSIREDEKHSVALCTGRRFGDKLACLFEDDMPFQSSTYPTALRSISTFLRHPVSSSNISVISAICESLNKFVRFLFCFYIAFKKFILGVPGGSVS